MLSGKEGEGCVHPLHLTQLALRFSLFYSFRWVVVGRGTDGRDLKPRARSGNPAAAGMEAAAVRALFLPCSCAGKVRLTSPVDRGSLHAS